ncbi:vacuolar protein sorting-associated protein 41 homolog [Onthophagus taurus]|uniref:vacuolar protein sorting-associated protein 41 homolog n=1 Tax=Onthophagus taurus TaxID=166361 RepID=UPI000C203D74|nr:vacuolar protein sorting-associated protein 41 homolog [Onthophagus taurus]
MSEPSTNDSQSTDLASPDEEDDEPKLKYLRLSNDLHKILESDAVKCISVHPKFICVGTDWGAIHVLDHQGNGVKDKKLQPHTVGVNQISIDSRGEFIASCSDDGKVSIHGLYTKEDVVINLGRLIKTVGLDPFYYKGGVNKRFITGDEKLTLHEKTLFGRSKSTVLSFSEGLVSSLAWSDNFIAWSSDIGVRVYDMSARCSLGLIKWEDRPGISPSNFKCNLIWSDGHTLLIGWVDMVRICVIRRRSVNELGNKELSEFLVDPISAFRTDFFISGIAPLSHQLVLLGFPKETDKEGRSLHPELHIARYKENDYAEIYADSLSLRGYQHYKVNNYHLDVLIEENRFFIVAPKDVVVASLFDVDDRIQWLIEQSKYKEALDVVLQSKKGEMKKYTKESVGIAYLDFLIQKYKFDEAGELCFRIFGDNKKLWEEEIFKFAQSHHLRSISRFIPVSKENRLSPQIYEMVLYEYLVLDSKGFLNLIKSWDHTLYNIHAVISALLGHIVITDQDKVVYYEALAILYSYDKQYDKCLATYLKLKHKDVFRFIRERKLYYIISDLVVDLMNLDHEETINLLLEKEQGVDPEIIVEKLKDHELHLYRYLDSYTKKNPTGQFHGLLVRLYAIYDRDKLLPFLQRSDSYPIQNALNICRNAKFYPEMVHLLDRIGDTKEALGLIMNELKDMQKAILFCQEHNDSDLWNDLIEYTIKKPECITFLLRNIGNYVDPTILINKIEKDAKIPDVKNSLVKMLCDYSLQLAIKEGCKKILSSDYFELHNKLVIRQQKGINICDEMVCSGCRKQIISKDCNRSNDIILYYCSHSFHKTCLPQDQDVTSCAVCHPIKRK